MQPAGVQISNTLPVRAFNSCRCFDHFPVALVQSPPTLLPTCSSTNGGGVCKEHLGKTITSTMKGRVRPTGQVGRTSRMTTRSLTASSRSLTASSDASQPPSEEASIFTVPPPRTPDEERICANAVMRAHVDMPRAAAAVDLAPIQLGLGTHEEAPSTCSFPSVSTPEKTLREYQSRIASKCEHENTLVVLPTGTGKTMIAAEVIKRLRRPALFLVPTRILVDQQAKVLRPWTGLNVVRCKGGDDLPHMPFHVLVATPDVFRAAQEKRLPLFQWSEFRVVIFDEVRVSPILAYCCAWVPSFWLGWNGRVPRRSLRSVIQDATPHYDTTCCDNAPPSRVVA